MRRRRRPCKRWRRPASTPVEKAEGGCAGLRRWPPGQICRPRFSAPGLEELHLPTQIYEHKMIQLNDFNASPPVQEHSDSRSSRRNRDSGMRGAEEYLLLDGARRGEGASEVSSRGWVVSGDLLAVFSPLVPVLHHLIKHHRQALRSTTGRPALPWR